MRALPRFRRLRGPRVRGAGGGVAARAHEVIPRLAAVPGRQDLQVSRPTNRIFSGICRAET